MVNAPNSGNEQKTYKILIVDDEEHIRKQFEEILTVFSNETNWEISQAVDGVDAIAKCEATKFDLIILDIVMPKKDGIETLTDIKNNPDKYGNPIILMITNIGGDLAVEEALKRGAAGYFVKLDLNPQMLIQTVKEHLYKIKPVSQN